MLYKLLRSTVLRSVNANGTVTVPRGASLGGRRWSRWRCTVHSFCLIRDDIQHHRMNKAKVIVVGAGASGVAAAARLMENGLDDIIVLEAENRLGGRIHSIPFDNGVLDLGAQWVHGEVGNVVFSMANEHGLLEASGTEMLEVAFIQSSGKLVNEEISEKIVAILSLIQKAGDKLLKDFKGSIGDYYTNVFNVKIIEELGSEYMDLGKYFLDWFQKFENSVDGSDSWFETSGRGLTEYWECEGNILLNWKSGGYRTALDLIMNKFPIGKPEIPVPSKVIFNKEVQHINWKNTLSSDRNGVLIRCSDGSSFEADHIVVTTGLGVLKERAHSMFTPALPLRKLNAIKGLGIGTVNKIFIKFPYRWWPEKHSGFSLLWTDEDARTFKPSGNTSEGVDGKHWLQDVFGFYSVDHHPLVLCGWIVGPPSRYMEQLSDEQVIQGCYELLQNFAGRAFNVTVPWPEHMVRSKWSANPHFRGSYSFRSMESEALGAYASHLAEPLSDGCGKPVLMFAGEATHDHYYSTVHGAIEAGRREADRILAYYGFQVPVSPVLHNMKSCQVVIIGAGIAGLAAAKTLLDGGLRDIVILEAQEYAGGRICSVPLNGSWIETGAQWIHGQKNEVWKIAHKYDLLSNITSVEGEGPYVRDDGVVFDPNLVKEIDDIVKDILEECEDYAKNGCDNKLIPPSIGYHLRERFAQYLNQCDDDEETIRMKEELYDWHYRFQIIDNSCSALEKLSAKAWGTYVFSGGEDYVNFNGGYSSLIRVMVGELPSGVLHLNSPVVKVKWKQDLQQEREESETNEVLRTLCKGINGVHLRNGAHNSSNGGTHEDSESLTSEGNSSPVEVSCSKGMVYTADHVIVTCSLGCLKENHKTLFDPQLPQSMTQAIEDMGFATINKIFLDFKKPWWSPDVKGFQLIWSKNSNVIVSDQERSSWTRDLTGFDVVFGQEGVLVGWVGGKGAELVEEISELEISHHCTELLKKFTLNENIPLPQKVVRSQWHKNPYVRGGYSNSTSLCDASKNGPSDLLTPILCDVYCKGVLTHRKHPVVLLAGEAAHEHFFSTTHGAYETGQKQARIILDYLNSP